MSDLIRLVAGLDHVAKSLNVVDSRVHHMEGKVSSVSDSLNQLIKQFRTFVESDSQAKRLQLGETRLMKVRQEIEARFRPHEEIRRRVTGILQATDISLVRQSTITTVTEELMLSAPGYWLAPCLVALAAWMGDNEPLAIRAVSEAERRNQRFTALFFALVAQRAQKEAASHLWINRYLQMQDPNRLGREVVIVLEAMLNGVFGDKANQVCYDHMKTWLDELSAMPFFVEQQRQTWLEKLGSLRGTCEEAEFPLLRQYSQHWPSLQAGMGALRCHLKILPAFQQIYESDVRPPDNLSTLVDQLLTTLVSRFDSQEIPLRREERKYALIVEEDGRMGDAQGRFYAERRTFRNDISLIHRLNDWALYPKTSGVSTLAQRFAVALLRGTILEAYHAVRQIGLETVPAKVVITIGEWTGKAQDAADLPELMESMGQFYEEKLKMRLTYLKQSQMHILGRVAIGLFATLLIVMGLLKGQPIFTILGIGGLVWLVVIWQKIRRERAAVTAEVEADEAKAKQALPEVLAELNRYRTEFVAEYQEGEKVIHFLSELEPTKRAGLRLAVQMVPSEEEVANGMASGLPTWDIQPVSEAVRRKDTLSQEDEDPLFPEDLVASANNWSADLDETRSGDL